MATATIKSKTGAVIRVKGTPEEVSKIVAAVETTTAVARTKEIIAEGRAVRKDQKKRTAASGLVVELKEEDFFNKPKGLTEIAKALEEKGYIYPVTTLSGVMLGLVQKRLLGRKKLDGKLVYGK